MKRAISRSNGNGNRLAVFVGAACALLCTVILPVNAQIGLNITPPVPGDFDPEEDLRAPKPLRLVAYPNFAGLSHAQLLFKVETKYDSTRQKYIATRYLLGRPYGLVKYYTKEDYRNWRILRQRKELLAKRFADELKSTAVTGVGEGLEIQVPFKIKSKTFRRIFGGDRVGLRVTGNITIDGGLRREKSDQVVITQNDRANYNFKIDQTQQFHIVGKVGDKVSVEIDQDSERLFEFENAVKLTYTGEEDEIIQSIEAGNVNLSLPGTQLATMTASNEGLFGFKTISKIGPLSITSIASLQKGEKNKKTFTGGSEAQSTDIQDADYIRDQYFFLDEYYRQHYPYFTSDFNRIAAGIEIDRIEVYKNVRIVSGDNNTYYEGWALYNPPRLTSTNQDTLALLNQQYDADDSLQSDRMAVKAFWQPLRGEGQDYTLNRQSGFIRLNTPSTDEDIIAIAFRVNTPLPNDPAQRNEWGVLDPTGTNIILRLLKPQNPNPDDATYPLSWKHIYWMRTSDLKEEDFEFKIVRLYPERKETTDDGRTWLDVFGLDEKSADGSFFPDGKIDWMFVNPYYGEVAFPDLRPFDQDTENPYYIVSGTDSLPQTIDIPDTLRNHNIYDVMRGGRVNIENNFVLEARYSNQSANISLGFNILEGSEEVYLNGVLLRRDVDYIIDYLSGQVTILNEGATAPGAKLEINYESGEILQLDKKTMLGIRLEYALWEDSFVGGTFLYFNEKPLDKRVKVGQEPTRNLIWDLNTRLRFRPYFMTRMVDALPLINTDEPSQLTVEGEIAQVFPNPNSLNSPSTGDPDGVAYIDDFESAKRSTPLGIMRRSWFPSSFPHHITRPDGVQDNRDFRCRLYWYNPQEQVKIKDIWPNREVNSKVAPSVHVLGLNLEPRLNNFRDPTISPESTWNGIMRWLSSGYNNQTNTKFIDIWMKWNSSGHNATMYIDMGEITEDVIRNGVLDTEDQPISGGLGNGILDEGEDTGLDKMSRNDPPWWTDYRESPEGRVETVPWSIYGMGDIPPYDFDNPIYDWWDLNGDGSHQSEEPFSNDDWNYTKSNYERVNGTQGNALDEGGRFPDTEDLDRNNTLNQANNFFRYRFRLSHNAEGMEDFDKYVVGGQDNPNGWRLVRIPIEDVFEEVGDPDLTQIKYLRLWVAGCTGLTQMQIAQFELAGNEWLEEPVVNPVTGDTTVYLSASTINTYDNPEDYNPPPGVLGEIDPIYDIRSKEQSLVIELLDLPTGAEGQLTKVLLGSQYHSYLEYKQLKMFVNGGGRNPEALNGKDLVMFFRFGSGLSGANRGYYEYTQRLQKGWAANEIVIDIDRLTRLKKEAEVSGTAEEVLSNGDIVRVVGKPSLGSIKAYAIGVRNLGTPVREEEGIEIWVDELRLSGVRKEPGMAIRTSVDAEFADFLDVHADLNQQDADFHRVDQRTSTTQSKSTIGTTVSSEIKLSKFIDPALGINLPVSGTMRHSLEIPKYISSNSDIRTESIAGEEKLNIWERFFDMAFSRDHLKDKYLLDSLGKPVEENGILKQDLAQWGIDTLFSTEQEYSWRTSFSKSKPSGNFFLHYTVDKLAPSFNHSQKYSSNLRNQYSKNFTNSGKLSYNLPFDKAELKILGWTDKIPVVNKLSDTQFNYLPTRINVSLESSETRSSQKLRNAAETPTYRLNLSRNISTSVKPFSTINMDYSYTVRSELVKEDSTRQQILYTDQPDSLRNLAFAPGTHPREFFSELLNHNYTKNDSSSIIIGDFLAALETARATWTGQDSLNAVSLLSQVRQDSSEASQGLQRWSDVLTNTYQELRLLNLPGWEDLKEPWEYVSVNDPWFKDKFLKIGGMFFLDTQKDQRITANFNPTLVNWFSTGFNYSANYSWKWQNKSYTQRSVSAASSIGANLAFKLRQVLPAEKKSGQAKGTMPRNRRGIIPPDVGGFGKAQDKEDQENNEKAPKDQEAPETKPKPPLKIPNPLILLLSFGHRIQDIRLDYTQNLNFYNPGVVDGTPTLRYQLGFTSDPGLGTARGVIATATSSRTDDYRIRSGVDWSSRITSALDYALRFDRSTGNQTTGSNTRSAFLLFKSDGISPRLFDVPNWTFRWSGIEQIGPIKKYAQTVTLEHSYNGSVSTDWNEHMTTVGTGDDAVNQIEKTVTKRNIDRQFNPLVGLNITWKYGISSNIRYNSSLKLLEDPRQKSRSRDTQNGITVNANYTRKTGFRVPIPIWPFKNKRFSNETTFSLAIEKSTTLKEVQRGDDPFEKSTEMNQWSIMPSIRYTFSKTVNGGARFKYGVTETSTNKTTYHEFGININISIRG